MRIYVCMYVHIYIYIYIYIYTYTLHSQGIVEQHGGYLLHDDFVAAVVELSLGRCHLDNIRFAMCIYIYIYIYIYTYRVSAQQQQGCLQSGPTPSREQ